MISISQLAASVIAETLKESGVPTGQSLRLIREKRGFSLQVDRPAESDRVIRYGGDIVLIVDKDFEDRTGGARIDVEETPEGIDLVMRRYPDNNTGEGMKKISRKTFTK